jgi:hypothetical protein
MLDEARRLVDAARAEGLTLRLLGGLAVREHCRSHAVCDRDNSDLDMVVPAKQARKVAAIFSRFGYAENLDVRTATAGRELQFVRPCAHGSGTGSGATHADDRVDVFLGTFRMDHDIALGERLDIEPYTVTVSDLLLTKLQIFRLEDKDLRDILTLLSDIEVGGGAGAGEVIDAGYIGDLCATDWGLFYDVAMNLHRVDERAGTLGLNAAQEARVRRGITRLIAAVDGTPKTMRWRLRARIGTRKAWHNEVSDQERPAV